MAKLLFPILIAAVLIMSGCTGSNSPGGDTAAGSANGMADSGAAVGDSGGAMDAGSGAAMGDSGTDSDGTFVAKTSDVSPGQTLDFEVGGEKAILINFNGVFKAYVNSCPHKGGPNELEGDKIVCQWHGSEFSPLTGENIKGPATTPLTQLEVTVKDGGVWVK